MGIKTEMVEVLNSHDLLPFKILMHCIKYM